MVFPVYFLTLARDYTWTHWGSDAGDLIGAVYTWGVPHPPGTPAYVLFLQPFRLIPFGTPAFKTNLASAIFALLATWLLALTVMRLSKGSILASLTAGLFLAFSPVFWSQAVITEVLTLHTFLSGLTIYSLVRWETGGSERWLCLFAFSLGLALANHTTAVMLIPAIGYLLMSRLGTSFLGRPFLLIAMSLLLGLSVYLYLPLRASIDPPFNWGRPDSLDRFLTHVTAQEYGQMLFYKSPYLVVDAAVNFLASLVRNFSYWGVLLATVGFILNQHQRKFLVFTAFVFLFQLLFLSEYKIPNIETFSLVAFWVFCLWIGLGVWLVGQVSEGFRFRLRKKMPVLLWSIEKPAFLGRGTLDYPLADFLLLLPLLIALVLPVWRLKEFWPSVDASQDREAAVYGEGVFEVLKPGAIVFTEGDRFSLVLDYERWVVHPDRKDVAVMVNGLYMQDWRLEHYRRLYPQLVFPDRPITPDPEEALAALFRMIEANIDNHPVYMTLDYPPPKLHLAQRLVVNDWILQSDGPIYEVLGKVSEGFE